MPDSPLTLADLFSRHVLESTEILNGKRSVDDLLIQAGRKRLVLKVPSGLHLICRGRTPIANPIYSPIGRALARLNRDDLGPSTCNLARNTLEESYEVLTEHLGDAYEQLLELLRTGFYIAEGIVEPVRHDFSRARVPTQFWSRITALVDFASSTLGDHDGHIQRVLFSDVRVVEAKPHVDPKIKAEGRCKIWLERTTADHPKRPPAPKPELRTEALQRFEGLSGRAFDRVWEQVIPIDHPWRQPGRPPKKSLQ